MKIFIFIIKFSYLFIKKKLFQKIKGDIEIFGINSALLFIFSQKLIVFN